MSTQVTSNLQVNLTGQIQNVAALGTVTLPLQYTPLISAALANGTGAGKANQAYVAQLTLAAAASTTLDLHAFSSALDAVGNTFALANVKMLIIQNLGLVGGTVLEADTLIVGGQGDTTAWTSPFSSNAATIAVNGGGVLLLVSPGANGYTVGSSSANHVLKLTSGASANTITFNVIIIGATA